MKPRVVCDLSEEDYHSHPALSSSGARKILPPSCPAKFKYEREHPVTSKDFDIGKAAHRLALGAGSGIVEVQYDSWRTKASQERGAELREAGLTPLLTREYRQVHAMADQLLQNKEARHYFTGEGVPEVSIFWVDDETGVECRARPDWLHMSNQERLIIPDLKTSTSANIADIERSIYKFGYHMQGDWYLTAAVQMGYPAVDATFVLVVQEKTPPYLVSTVQIEDYALAYAHERNRLARRVFAECTLANEWPDYMAEYEELPRVGLPTYAYREDDR